MQQRALGETASHTFFHNPYTYVFSTARIGLSK